MKRKVISCVLAGASAFSLVCINGGNLVAKADGDVTEIRFTEWDGGDTLAVYEEIDRWKRYSGSLHDEQ